MLILNETNIRELESLIEKGYISKTKHPTADLWILNYTPSCQYDKLWNEITLACRGLIVDENYVIKARPFVKFFNYEEVPADSIPHLPFTLTYKLDGSCGILYWIGNVPYIATRGSFTSEQALHATEILHTRYEYELSQLEWGVTYIFEIIYPQNRIVVDYGETDDIILTGMIDTKTGGEFLLNSNINPGFNHTNYVDGVKDFKVIRELNEANTEGYVVRFENGYRLKLKYAEYVRLHRILTNVTSYTIYEHLRDGRDIEELIANVPDEFYAWVKRVYGSLLTEYGAIERPALKLALYYLHQLSQGLTRKEMAEQIKDRPDRNLIFTMVDGKNYGEAIWKKIKPSYEKPFSNVESEE